MKNPFSDIDKALGVFDPVETAIQQNNIVVPKKVVKSNEDDIENDYKYQRENFYGLVERGQDAIEGILVLAKEGEHPRAYEVAGQLIKSVSDATDKLMELQKKLKDVEEDAVQKGPTNVTNALFVGSTAELQKMIKKADQNINS